MQDKDVTLRDYLAGRRAEIERKIGELQTELAQITVAEAAIGSEPTLEVRLSLRKGSIKEAVVGILRQHASGLKTDDIIKALAEVGKTVMRSSLTPQLSRLKDAGVLTQVNSLWILTSMAEPAA